MLMNGRGNWKLRARPRCVRSCAIKPVHLLAVELTLPFSLCSVPQMQLTSVLLAGTVGSDQTDTFALRDGEIDAVERDEAAETLAEASYFEQEFMTSRAVMSLTDTVQSPRLAVDTRWQRHR